MDDVSLRPVAASFDQGQVPDIACVNQATTALGVDWAALISVLGSFADLYARIWGTPARIVDAGTGPVPAGHWAIVFLDDADQAGALGYHDLTPDQLPLSKIFVRTTVQAGDKVSVTATHELAEMLVDPGIQMGAVGPDQTTWYAYETADAVEQETFQINGIDVTNFVYPAWFEGFRPPQSAQFDYLGSCKSPFELRPGGYISVFKNGTWSQIFGSLAAQRNFDHSRHPRAEARARTWRHVSTPRSGSESTTGRSGGSVAADSASDPPVTVEMVAPVEA